MVSEYKILNEKLAKGTTLSELDFLKLLKFSYRQNKKMFEQLKEKYEHLEQKKLDYNLIGVRKWKE
ncbi:MAG: hypothetical protein ACOC22_01805 [bacterium]